MRRAMLMLFAMAFVVSIAYAGFDGLAGPEQKAFDGKWDESKCFENDHGHHMCTEICPGSKPYDKCGCDHGCKEQCDYGNRHDDGHKCFVFEKCDECGKTVCDGKCKDCGKKCDVYEYCPGCNAKYYVKHADGSCDKCGRDCYCIEKCIKCGHNQYYNGYCDECADKCYYGRCCFDFDHADHAPYGDKCAEECDSCMGAENYADAEPVLFTIFMGEEDGADAGPAMDEGYPGVQDAQADQMPLIYPLEDEAPIDEAPVDGAPVDEI